MVTQLRAVTDDRPTYVPLFETINGLAFARCQMEAAIPEADEISFSFGPDNRLIVLIKVAKREDRQNILYRLREQMIRNYRFERIIEGVETGARRRLTITAEVL